ASDPIGRRVLPRAPVVRAHRRRPDPGAGSRLRARRHPRRAHPDADDQPARRPAGGGDRRRGPRAGRPGGARGHLGLRRRRRPHRRRGRPPGRGGRRGGHRVRGDQQRPRGAGPRAGVPRRHLGLRVRDRPVRAPGRREDGAAHRVLRAAAGRRRRRARAEQLHARQGAEVLRRHRRHPHPPAARAHQPRVHRADRRPRDGLLREHAHARAAGRPGLGVPHRRQLGLGPGAGRDPRAAAREDQGAVGRGRPLRPGHRPLEPVADHPRVDRPRHRAGPGAGLRGRLRRHVLRHGRQAGHAAVRLAVAARHRRPHHPARPVHGRLGRRGRGRAGVGHREGRRAGRLPGRPEHGPAARPAPLQRLRLRRLPGPRARAADGERVAAPRPRRPVHRRDHRRGRARHLRRRRQELVDRHAALQLPVHRPAVLPDRGREAGRPAPRRRLPGHDDGLLGLDVGRRRAADLRPGGRLQLRQGPTRAGGAGEPWLPDRPLRPGVGAQHGAGGRPV
ncbi:MAG: TldD family protein, Actinobacterial subgroup, partial [uncultured Nocardioidaceae bacterium]